MTPQKMLIKKNTHIYAYPIIFIFYDAGTTKALAPVMGQLDKKNIDYCIIAFGTSKALLDKHPHYLDVNTKLGIKAIVDRLDWLRETPLDEDDANLIQRGVSCLLAVVGTSSIIEVQLAKKLKEKAIKVVAYFDAFASPEIQPALFKPFAQTVDEVIVPSHSVAAGFNKLHPSSKILVLGQPTIDIWTALNTSSNIAALKQKLLLNSPQAILLYAGGYGKGYEDSFRLFLEATKVIKNYRIIISLHPKVLGATEKRIMKEMGKEDLQILPSHISTIEASIISNIIVSQCSTVGVQARFIGKKVIYLDATTGYSDIIIEKKLGTQVHNVKTFLNVLAEAANDNTFIPEAELYQRTGIAPNATNNILGYLEKSLAELQKSSLDNKPVVETTNQASTSVSACWLPSYNVMASRSNSFRNNLPCVAIDSNSSFADLKGSYHCCSMQV